jgi:hypothetical protein
LPAEVLIGRDLLACQGHHWQVAIAKVIIGRELPTCREDLGSTIATCLPVPRSSLADSYPAVAT